jgi:hypothetical protein
MCQACCTAGGMVQAGCTEADSDRRHSTVCAKHKAKRYNHTKQRSLVHVINGHPATTERRRTCSNMAHCSQWLVQEDSPTERRRQLLQQPATRDKPSLGRKRIRCAAAGSTAIWCSPTWAAPAAQRTPARRLHRTAPPSAARQATAIRASEPEADLFAASAQRCHCHPWQPADE